MKKKKVRYHRCSCCDNKAVWEYMPSHIGKIFYCDNCVPRGCTCNLFHIEEIPDTEYHDEGDNIKYWDNESVKKYIDGAISNKEFDKLGSLKKREDSTYYTILDEYGRRLPCCEYDYNEDGFEIEVPEILIMKKDILEGINRVIRLNDSWSKYINWDLLINWLKDDLEDCLQYNKIFDMIRLKIKDEFKYTDLIEDGFKEYRSDGIIERFIFLIRNRVRIKRFKRYVYE